MTTPWLSPSVMSGIASPSVQEILNEIDQQIHFHEARLLTLKARRNSLVPILNLPQEIIGRIIKLTQLTGIQEPYTRPGFLECRLRNQWRRIMLVSKSFRAVALAVPEIWAFINMNWKNTEWTVTSLERAKSVPLVLDCRIPYRKSGAHSYELTMANFSRAYAASLLIRDNNQDQIVALLQTAAPQLNTLQLTGNLGSTNILNVLPNLSIQLVELTLLRVGLVDGHSFSWPTLKRLRLDDVSITPTTFLSLLFEMPSLEDLVVRHMTGLDGEAIAVIPVLPLPQDVHRRVLQHLRTVMVQMEPLTCMALLRVLHPFRHICQQLNVDIVGHDDRHTDDLDETIVGVFEYVIDGWAHLFSECLSSPVSLVWNLDAEDYQHSFKLTSHQGKTHALASTLDVHYVLALAPRYQTRGIAFVAVEVEGVYSGIPWIPELTTLWNTYTPNATKLVLRDCWDFTGLLDWLLQRRETTCAITTVELNHTSTLGPDEEMIKETEKLRASGAVENFTIISAEA
jgi:hypothetical protein